MSKPLPRAVAGLMCAAALAAQAEDAPQWLVEAKARESRLAQPNDVASEDGLLRAQVPGTLKKKVLLEDGSYSVAIGLEAGIEISCEVFPGSHDLAAILAKTSETSFVEIQKVNGTVEARALESSGAGAVGPYPYLSLQWIYRARRNGEARVGSLKQFIAATDDALAYCANDDVGYTKTFETVSRALASSLRLGDSQVKPYFREISVVSLDGARVGVATTTLTRDEDGDIQVVSKSALLVATAPDQLVSQALHGPAQAHWCPDRVAGLGFARPQPVHDVPQHGSGASGTGTLCRARRVGRAGAGRSAGRADRHDVQRQDAAGSADDALRPGVPRRRVLKPLRPAEWLATPDPGCSSTAGRLRTSDRT